MTNDLLLVLARILVAAVFLVSGAGMFATRPRAVANLKALGVPFASLLIWPMCAFKIIASLCILAGYQMYWASLAFSAFVFTATMIAHRDFSKEENIMMFMINIGFTGALIGLAIAGGGAYSVDAALAAAQAN